MRCADSQGSFCAGLPLHRAWAEIRLRCGQRQQLGTYSQYYLNKVEQEKVKEIR